MLKWFLAGALVLPAAVVPNVDLSERLAEQLATVHSRLLEVKPQMLFNQFSEVTSPLGRWLTEQQTVVKARIEEFTLFASQESNPKSVETSRYRFASVERGDLVSTVTATGQLTPVATVNVSTQISGQIERVTVDFNSQVRRGEIIATIEGATFEIAVALASAELAAAKAFSLKADVGVREATAGLERRNNLLDRGVSSLVDRNAAHAAKDLADAHSLEAIAGVQRAEASLQQALTTLRHTEIRSPVHGVIVDKSIEEGQIVAASFQAPTLFTIAQDLRDMQVNMSIDEAAIGRIEPGNSVEFMVDAYPERRFVGWVEQVRLAPATSQNVVTYTVIVKAPNPDLALLPGMTATAEIVVAERREVLKVPMAAIRFRQPEERSDPAVAVLWLERGGELWPVNVRLGQANDDVVELLGESVEPGDEVAVGLRPVPQSTSSARRLIGLF